MGDLFFAHRGADFDGNRFIPDAIAAGAVAVVTDLYDPFCSLTQMITPSVNEMKIELAKRFYNFPAKKLKMVGITGTNGKTTTSYLVRHLLDDCSLIGTIEAIVGNHHFPSQLTTPDVIDLQKLLQTMVNAGSKECVMEVSSHALQQKRVAGIGYDIAVFTNLTQDHLDYHHSMENYFLAKEKLFTSLSPKATAILNADCPYHKRIKTSAKKLTYGIDSPADLRAFDIKCDPESIEFTLVHEKTSVRIVAPMIGKFNIYNCLAAIGVALISKIPLQKIAKRLTSFPPVSGRMQRVPNGLGLHVFIDYAHTADALDVTLKTLKPLCEGRLFVLFGCGGDRDQDKRAKMGDVASKLADQLMITSDNPRSEDPLSICQTIASGCLGKNYFIEPDRKKAIETLIEMAKPDDCLLIAGKGAERTQTFADKTYPFDDKEVIEQALAKQTSYRV